MKNAQAPGKVFKICTVLLHTDKDLVSLKKWGEAPKCNITSLENKDYGNIFKM